MLQENLMSNELRQWSETLGLLPVPLFAQSGAETFVLLNGTRGSFCLDLERSMLDDRTRSYAWSADVGHYVSAHGNHVEVQTWAERQHVVERFTRSSIMGNLEQFHTYLEKESPQLELSIVSHAIRVYRSIRSMLGQDLSASQSLQAFLYMLASVTDQVDRTELDRTRWRLSDEAEDIAVTIPEGPWMELQGELRRGVELKGLKPDFSLVLRHASGRLFQEAHYEAIFLSQPQLPLHGIAPLPVERGTKRKGSGAYFTPPALVRSVVEEALRVLDTTEPTLTIFDPACGSGEFLRESIRQLRLRGFSGEIHIVGWDISEAACEMANFVLAWESRDSQGRIVVDLKCVDALSTNIEWPDAVDLVVMNPPFVSWETMTPSQQDVVTDLLGQLRGQRPDMAHAFMVKAASVLKDGGVLGTIVPAPLFYRQSARAVRKYLSELFSPRLVARLGSPLLFSDATVDSALYVAKKGQDLTPATAMWSDHLLESTSNGLKYLRRLRYLEEPTIDPVLEEGFNIYPTTTLGRSEEPWSPRPFTAFSLLEDLALLPKVKNLFEVRQGIRTGDDSTFVLHKRKWEKLPAEERSYFRPAVENASIDYGFLKTISYVFYPYGSKEIETEEELRQVVPSYFGEYLGPARATLAKRSGIDADKWWQLTRHRTWQIEPYPKLVSTDFGDAGSFAWDATGDSVVLRGWAWLPKKRLDAFSPLPRSLALAYLAILNSPIFSQLISAVSRHIGGGQWDLAAQFMKKVPLPDFFDEDANPDMIRELAMFGSAIHAGKPFDEDRFARVTSAAYGVQG